MQICKLNQKQMETATELCKEVFMEFEAPFYEELGVKTFMHFIQKENICKMLEEGNMRFWGCYDGKELVGVCALRGKQHISLFFVKKEYQRQGIGRSLMKYMIEECEKETLDKPFVTVNSSPYGVPFYHDMGFAPMSAETTDDGIRYTPMVYKLMTK